MHTTARLTTKYQHSVPKPKREVCNNRDCARVQREIRTAVSGAAEVHHALCAPEWQQVEDFEIATRIIPVRHVGGDFVCTLQVEGSTLAVLGDLMGKGLSAAMWITHIIDLVHRAAENFSMLSEMMAKLNAELIRSRVRAPLTSAFAILIDHRSSQVSCTSAGHPPAILVRADASTELLSEGGPLLGVFADAQYKVRTFGVGVNDAVVAFSDGVIETERSTDEQFSVERALRILARHAAAGARQKVAALFEASQAFGGGRVVDDVSALVVQHA